MCKTGFIVIVTIVTNYDYQLDNLLSQKLTVRVVEAGRPGRLGVSTESVGAVRFRKGQGLGVSPWKWSGARIVDRNVMVDGPIARRNT